MGIFRWFFYAYGYKLISFLPWSVLCFIGNINGTIRYYLSAGLRETVRRNMGSVFPEKLPQELDATVKSWFRHMAKVDLEHWMCYKPERVPIKKVAHTVNFDKLREALKDGKGVLALGGHTSCPLLIGRLFMEEMAEFGGDTVVRAVEDLPDDYWIRKYDDIMINKVFPKVVPKGEVFRRKGSTKKMLQALANNHMVVLWHDGPITADIPVTFLGHRVKMASGMIMLALAAGCPMVPVIGKRLPGDVTVFEAFGPIRIEPSDDIAADIPKYVMQTLSYIEAIIRERPETWELWPKFHERWLDGESVEQPEMVGGKRNFGESA